MRPERHHRSSDSSDDGPIRNLLRALSRRPSRDRLLPAEAPLFSLPPGHRVYAIGDVHGHADLLDAILAAIDADLVERPADGLAVTEVFLGDYVDRGPASRDVLQHLVTRPPARRSRVCLRGNHEEFLLRFLDEPGVLFDWTHNGGVTTLASYGVHASPAALEPQRIHQEFLAAFPDRHREFLAGLPYTHRLGDILFVHAGIRPGVPLEAQDPHDLLTIRREFLDHRGPLPVRVVHGHTPVQAPVVTPYRIDVDTGAFASGTLTCVVMEGAEIRFLSTG